MRLCCSILPVRGIWDNEHNTHQKHFTSLCPGLRKRKETPKNTASSLQNHKIETAALQASNQTALRTTPWHANNQLVVHFGTHTNTNTHYTASGIQAPFGCPANPALVVHALEHLRLCCSILPVRGIWDNEHNTHQKRFTSLCPGLRRKKKNPKNTASSLQNHKIEMAALQASNQTALRTTPWHANNQLVVHFGTHTPTPTHTTLL